MSKKWTKYLTLLTACVCLWCLMPSVTAAASSYGNGSILAVDVNQDGAKEQATGSCGVPGAELQWTIYESDKTDIKGILVISGTGQMMDYDSGTGRAPWFAYLEKEGKSNLYELVLEPGVTYIGLDAFGAKYDNVNESRSRYVYAVGNLVIPESVTGIGGSAFADNEFTGDLYIPDSVKTIGDKAFHNLEYRTCMFDGSKILVGYGLENAEKDIFSGVAGQVGSTIYNLSGTGIATSDSRYGEPKVGTTYKITKHYDDAVQSKRERIVLPDDIFTGSKYEKYHSFPNEYDKIGDVEFDWYLDAEYTQLITETITSFSADLEVYGRVKGTDKTAYGTKVAEGNCSADGKVKWAVYDSFDMDDAADTLVISGAGEVADYENGDQVPWKEYKTKSLIRLVLEEGLTGLGNYAFYDSSYDSQFGGTLKLPSTVKKIGNYSLCGNLFEGELRLPEGLESVGAGAFSDTHSGTLELPGSLKEIGDRAFRTNENAGYSKIVVSPNVESMSSIGDYTPFPSGNYTYYNLSALKFTAYYHNRNSRTPTDGTLTIVKHYDDAAQTVVERKALPDEVTTTFECYEKYHSFPNDLDNDFQGVEVTWYADEACQNQIAVGTGIGDLPAHVKNTSTYKNEIHVYAKTAAAGTYYASAVIATGSCGEHLTYTLYDSITDEDELPEVLEIKGYGEMYDYNNESNRAPWYDYTSFSGSYKNCVKSLVFVPETDGKGITRIGSYAFYQFGAQYPSAGMKHFEIPDTVESIGSYAFDACRNWSSQYVGQKYPLRFPANIKRIENYAFEGVDEESPVLLLPENCEIGEYAFAHANSGDPSNYSNNKSYYIVPSGTKGLDGQPLSQNIATARSSAYRYAHIYDFSDSKNQSDKYDNSSAYWYQSDYPYGITGAVVVNKVCGKKTTSRIVLREEYFSKLDLDTAQPELKQYFTFPSALDQMGGKDVEWYLDAGKQELFNSGLVWKASTLDSAATWLDRNTDKFTVYAACPGHSDADDDGYCDFCDEIIDQVGATLKGHSISMKGNVGVNFYMELTEGVIEDQEAYILFTIKDAVNGDSTVKAPLDDGSTETVNGKTYYKFTCPVTARQMSTEITAQMFVSDGAGGMKGGKEYTYTVMDYADYILDHASEYSSETVDVVKAMLNYGAMAQVHFGYRTGELANAKLTEAEKSLAGVSESNFASYTAERTGNGTVGGLTYRGSSVSLKSETSIKHYFALTEGAIEDYKFELVDGSGALIKDLTDTVDQGSGMYFVEIPDIPARALGENYYLKVTSGAENMTVRYSVMYYGKQVMGATTGEYAAESVKNVIKAMYLYYQKAKAYAN